MGKLLTTAVAMVLALAVGRPAFAQCTDFLGFTAATGAEFENQDLLSWSVVDTPINFADFSSTTGLNLIGSASQVGTVVRLTPAAPSQDGAAWFTTRLSLLPGFDTTFQFQFTDFTGGSADGIAFVVQNSLAGTGALGDAGGGIGYQGISNSLAVEFDTFQNTNFGDPSCDHVSVHTRGTFPNSADQTFALGTTCFTLADGNPHTAHIVYVPGTLNIFMDGAMDPTLSVSIDLAALGGLGCQTFAPAMRLPAYLGVVALLTAFGVFHLARRRTA